MSRQPQIEPSWSSFFCRTTRLDEEPSGSECSLIKSQETVQKTTSKKAEYTCCHKPPYTYVVLITTAIMSSPEKKLMFQEILDSIKLMFPFFRGDYKGWKSTVSSTLSEQDCFIKEPLYVLRRGKPYIWSVDLFRLSPNVFKRRSSYSENAKQYAITLHEELGLPEIVLTQRPERSQTPAYASCGTGHRSLQNSPNDAHNLHSIFNILNREHSDNYEVLSDRSETTATPTSDENDYNVFNLSYYERFRPNTDLAPQQSVPAVFQYSSFHDTSDFPIDLSQSLDNLETPCLLNLPNSSGQISDVGIGANHPSFNQEDMSYMDMESRFGYSSEPVLQALPHSSIPIQCDSYLTASAIDLSIKKRKLSE